MLCVKGCAAKFRASCRDRGHDLLAAWIAKERLRDLLALARAGADRHRIGHPRFAFLTWCADSGIPESTPRTLDRWWPRIAAF